MYVTVFIYFSEESGAVIIAITNKAGIIYSVRTTCTINRPVFVVHYFPTRKNTPVGGIVQDGCLVALIVILGGIIPIYMLFLIPKINKVEVIVVFIAAIFLLVVAICWPFSLCLKNNVGHQKVRYEKAQKIYLENRTEEVKISMNKQLKGLYEHLRNQNLLTIISTMVYCFIPIIGIFSEYRVTHFSKGIKRTEEAKTHEIADKKDKDISAFKKFKQDYIPDKRLSQLNEE